MALANDYLVWGHVSDSASAAVVGATVQVTGAAGSVSTTTIANGFYQINIKNACNTDGETVTVEGSYGVAAGSETFTLDISGAAEGVDLQLLTATTVAVQTYAVFVANEEVPNVFKCKYDDPSITTSNIPTFEVETDNITGRNINEYSIGSEVLIYRYGTLVFKGIVQPRNFEKSADGSKMTFGGNHKGYDNLANRVCDYYRANNLSYAPVVNPWRFGRKTDESDELVDGVRPDDIIKCLIGEKFIWQEWFDNHDYLLHYAETVYASNVNGGSVMTFGSDQVIGNTFTVSDDVTITRAAFKLKKNVQRDVVATLCTVDGSNEPDTILATTTVDGDDIPSDYDWVYFDWTDIEEIRLDGQTTYCAYLNTNTGVSIDISAKRSKNNPYPNGNVIYSTDGGTTWVQQTSYDLQFKIYGKTDKDTLAVIDSAVRLPKTNDSTVAADSYALSGQIESIPLYNGDKYVDEMGEITEVSATLVGEKYDTYNPVLKVCRDASSTTPTWHTVSTSYDGDGIWTGTYTFSDSPAIDNEFAFCLSMNGDGDGSTNISYARFDCVTVSDTSVTAGSISAYDDPNVTDDTVAINLSGLTRLEAIEKVRKLTNTSTVYADPNWDCYIDNDLELHFQEARGSDIDHTFSFNNTNLKKLHQKFDGEIKNSLIAVGQGEEPYAVTITGSSLQDATSIATYGQKTGYFIDKSLPDAPTLYKRAKAYLKYMKDPRETVDVEITNDLALAWDVGDRIKVDDDELALSDEYYRVVSRSIDYTQEDGETVDIELNSKSDTMADIFRNIQGKFNSQEVITQGTSAPSNTIAAGLVYDSTYAAEYTFYVPENAQRVLISAKTHKYRAYAKAAEGGGAVTTTTADGGATTPTSSDDETGESIKEHTQIFAEDYTKDTSVSDSWIQLNVASSVHGTFGGINFTVIFYNRSGDDDVYDFMVANTTTSQVLWTNSNHTVNDGWIYTHNHNISSTNVSAGDEIRFTISEGVVGTEAGAERHGYMKLIVTTYSSHDHTVTIPAHDHNVTLPVHTHDLTFGIYENDYYPAKTCMRIDSLISPTIQKFGFIGSEDTGAEVIDLDISDELKDENGKITPGRHTLYFSSQGSDNNTTGLGIIGVNHKIVVKTADDVSLTPL